MRYLLMVTLLLGVTLLVPSCATQEVSSSEISSATSLSEDEKANEDIIGELVEQLKDIFN